MRNKSLAIALVFFTMVGASASTTVIKQIDTIQNTTGGTAVSVPSVGSALQSESSTATLSNKSMSGASNTFTLIPVGAIGNGSVLSGSNTGDVTLGTASGLSLTGQALSLGVASAGVTGALTGTDWSTFNGKQDAGSYITALTGDVTAAGPGSSAATLATVNSNVGSFTNANITVNAKGLITAASNGSGSLPALNGGSASPESVTAGGGISLSGITVNNMVWVAGSGGAVTVTKLPSVTACTADGQHLQIIGTSATNTVTLQDDAGLSGSGLFLNGNWTGGLRSVLSLHCDITSGNWVEDSRSN